MTDFQKQYLQRLLEEEKEELSKNADLIEGFKKHASQYGIALKDENFRFYQTTGIVATYPNLVSHLHHSLITDKEGLLDFKKICKYFEKRPFAKGYLYGEKFMLMAHPHFRRGFHHINNFAPRFVELFWKFNNQDVDTYILLDPDRVRINVDDTMYMEFDTWYGAQFNQKIENIPNGIVKLRPPLDVNDSCISFFFADTYCLDIKWATKNGIKSFQAEEFKTDEIKIIVDNTEYFPVRYVHAEFDLEKEVFRHFDGAIHFYTTEEYYRRRDSDFNYNTKNSSHIKTYSRKLFKMNGIVDTETWIEFTSQFFTANPLVFEYFEGQYPKHVQEVLKNTRQKK